jgi:hypothetical protein
MKSVLGFMAINSTSWSFQNREELRQIEVAHARGSAPASREYVLLGVWVVNLTTMCAS